ncbi:MAG TPA: FkbM family methyltransferase [Mucilaginibacter sp.]|jgi:FkbM family methyltransferase
MSIVKAIKRLIPNNIKQEGKYLLLDLLKTPYSRSAAPLEILKWLPKNDPITFFDIGASVGNFSKCICGEYKIKKGILVEPVSKLIPILENVFPDKETFHVINAAVSDVISESDFYYNEDADFVSSLLRIDNKGEGFASLNFADPVLTKIQALTLDHIVNKQNILNIDLIKIDVQGAEHLVLHGGIETLKRTKLVFTEFSYKPLYENSSTFFDLYKIFYENNFILVNITSNFFSANGELLQGDALFVNKALMN